MPAMPRSAFAIAPALFALLAAAGPARAQDAEADAPAPRAALAILAEPVSTQAVDEDIAAQSDALSQDIGRAIDATIAQSIAATGGYTGFGMMTWLAGASNGQRAIVVNGYSRPKGAMFADPGVQWSQLAKQEFGSPETLAVGVEQKFADSRNMATQVRLRHVAGPVDVRVIVKGTKPLATADPMQISYDSSAIYQVSSALELGMVAKGSLGSLGDFTPGARQHNAGALARIKLLGKDRTLSAETGYDMRLGPGTENLPGRFHMNLNFNWKL